MVDLKHHISVAIRAAMCAGAEILDVYCQDHVDVELKADDTPLTQADTRAHNVIQQILKETGLPLLSEEGAHLDFQERKQWPTLWIVDPLDGTREFVSKNGEFCVCIALVHHGTPVAGVIYSPVKDTLWYGIVGLGAFKVEEASLTIDNFSVDTITPLAITLPYRNTSGSAVIVASRSHLDQKTSQFIEHERSKHPRVEIINIGSALKFCLVAEGKATLYPRFAPTCEWDTAAGHALVKAVGGEVFQEDTDKPLQYNKANLLNPGFVVRLKQ